MGCINLPLNHPWTLGLTPGLPPGSPWACSPSGWGRICLLSRHFLVINNDQFDLPFRTYQNMLYEFHLSSWPILGNTLTFISFLKCVNMWFLTQKHNFCWKNPVRLTHDQIKSIWPHLLPPKHVLRNWPGFYLESVVSFGFNINFYKWKRGF